MPAQTDYIDNSTEYDIDDRHWRIQSLLSDLKGNAEYHHEDNNFNDKQTTKNFYDRYYPENEIEEKQTGVLSGNAPV